MPAAWSHAWITACCDNAVKASFRYWTGCGVSDQTENPEYNRLSEGKETSDHTPNHASTRRLRRGMSVLASSFGRAGDLLWSRDQQTILLWDLWRTLAGLTIKLNKHSGAGYNPFMVSMEWSFLAEYGTQLIISSWNGEYEGEIYETSRLTTI